MKIPPTTKISYEVLLKSVPYKFLSTQLVYRVELISVKAEKIPRNQNAISKCTKNPFSLSAGVGSADRPRAIMKITKTKLKIIKPMIKNKFTVLVYFSAQYVVQFVFVIAFTSYKLRATKRKASDWHQAKQISPVRSKALIAYHLFVFQSHISDQASQRTNTIVVKAKM